MVKNPCKKNCPGRSATCHCECKAYLAYAEAKNAEYDDRRAALDRETYTADAKRRAKSAERLRKAGRMK